VSAGRAARLAGRIPKRDLALASSPIEGTMQSLAGQFS
ncbi:thiazole synthase, partial [Glutamicibacter creatinolyticus]